MVTFYLIFVSLTGHSQILTKDSVTVNVDAIVQFRIRDPVASIKYVNNAAHATRLLAQTTLRNSLGAHTLSEILSSKDTIQEQMRVRERGKEGEGEGEGGREGMRLEVGVSEVSSGEVNILFSHRKSWMRPLTGGEWMCRRWKCEFNCAPSAANN